VITDNSMEEKLHNLMMAHCGSDSLLLMYCDHCFRFSCWDIYLQSYLDLQ